MSLALRSDGTLAKWLASRDGALTRAGMQLQDAVLSSDLDGMRALFQPLPTSSGYPVTDHTALMVSTVFACLSKIGGAVLQVPLHEYSMSRSGDREQVLPLSALWWMLNEQPTAMWTAASWKEWIVYCVHLRGDQHTEIIRERGVAGGGKIIGLLPHHPDRSRARRYRTEAGEVRLAYDFTSELTGETYTRDQDDVLHFSGFGFNGVHSISVIQQAARNAVGNTLAASDYAGKSLGSGAMPKIALTYPQKMSPDQAILLRDSFVSTYGNGPTQRQFPLILTEGGTASPLNISPVDMELLGSRKLEQKHICEACGVPPIMIGDSEKTSAWGTGVEQITLGFVKYTLKPHLRRWQEEQNRKLYRRAGRFVEYDLDELLRGDSKAQAEAFRFALGGPGSGDGWLAVDEVRKSKNLPQLGGEYAKPFRAQRGIKAAGEPPPADPGKTNDPDDEGAE